MGRLSAGVLAVAAALTAVVTVQPPGYSPDTGTFTQVVWKDTDVLGCGRTSGRPEGGESYQTFIVCSYGPAGNIIGRFRANVGEPVGG
ncbi:hypothetical protein [Streptomyces sp. NRRL S-1896]|uniref:hypothetical protein n=1 Tax=Streptomyces sp. NRRL S-1896 TaxID=1463893 RepID=UPI00131CAA56|nr:hypothetical protein [Streptomyces sp. NRRL S-1896]